MRVFFIFLFGIVISTLLWVASYTFEAAQKNQITYRYIADALVAQPFVAAGVVWRSNDTELVRPFTSIDAEVIGKVLSESWQILTIAQSTGEASILTHSFTGVALERAKVSVNDAKDFGGRMVVLRQQATPVFYHLDGSLFQAEIETLTARFITDGTGLS